MEAPIFAGHMVSHVPLFYIYNPRTHNLVLFCKEPAQNLQAKTQAKSRHASSAQGTYILPGTHDWQARLVVAVHGLISYVPAGQVVQSVQARLVVLVQGDVSYLPAVHVKHAEHTLFVVLVHAVVS